MKRSAETKRACFCFTYNNYTEEGEEKLKTWLAENCKFACYGHEIAPETGTPHLQGYFSLKKQNRMSTLQKTFQSLGINLALIGAKGSARQNLDYCSKSDKEGFWMTGDIKIAGQGARTDLSEVAQSLKSKKTIEDIADNFPEAFIKYHRGIRELKAVYDKKDVPHFRDITVSVYYGEGGTGKSAKSVNDCRLLGYDYYILNPPNSQSLWWDNYSGEKAIIIDDFYGWIKPHDLYRVLDGYKLQLPIKGSHTWALYTHIWITSNQHPNQWYKVETMNKLDSTAYNRRFHNIYNFLYTDEEKTSVRIEVDKEEKRLSFYPREEMSRRVEPPSHDDDQREPSSDKTTNGSPNMDE